MMRKAFVFSMAVVLACAFAVSQADDKDKPKYTTKEVMKKALKGPLHKKVVGGKASDAEKKELHELYVALSKNKPKKGDAASWKKLTGALVSAAKDAVDGKDGAAAKLKKAGNCAACHKAHK